jgi:RNA polymerase sigma-70 factor (ECF subfamily)
VNAVARHQAADARGLVAGLRARDERAFLAVYELYADRVYAFAMRLSGRRDAADELFQHAWVRLAEHAPRLGDDANLLAWLLTVARNHWRSERRKAGTHARHEAALDPGEDTAARPDERAERRATLARLEAALMALPEQHREVLVVMIEADDVPQHELARILGLAPDVFRKRLSRARSALAELLENEGQPS